MIDVMKSVLVIFFILFYSSISFSQAEIILNISCNNKEISIPAVFNNNITYVSGSGLESGLGISKFFNTANNKLELKFEKYYLKFSANSNFVIITSKETGEAQIIQMPVYALLYKKDIYIPIYFCKDIFSRALQSELKIERNAKSLLVEEDKTQELSNSDNTPKPEIQPADGTIKKDAPEIITSDIRSIHIEEKANGTLINIKCSKKITKYSANIDKGILYVNIVGLASNNGITKNIQPKGLVKKINYKKLNSNSQFEIYLNEGYSTSEAFLDPSSNEIMISIHNKLLANNAAANKQKDRWVFDAIVIDAGHGGKDPGAIGVSGTKEKDVNLAIALKLGQYIKDEMKDVKVTYTRSTDKFVELYRRGKIANENDGKLFISIHCNSMPKKASSRSGFEVYLLRPGRTTEAIAIAEAENSVIRYEDHPEKYQELTDENFILVSMAHSSYMRYSEQFSDLLNKQFSSDLSIPSNGVKQAGFYVLVGASMPSVLVEAGFLSNKKDEAYLKSKEGQNEIARSIFKAIKLFKEQYDKVLKAEL